MRASMLFVIVLSLASESVSVQIVGKSKDLRPRIVLSHECSGSSFVVRHVVELLQTQDIPAVMGGIDKTGKPIDQCEMGFEEKNPYIKPGVSMADAIDSLISTTQSFGYAPVIKFMAKQIQGHNLAPVLEKYGALQFINERTNLLDHAICMVKDCFALVDMQGNKMCRFPDKDCGPWPGYNVNTTSGEPSDACFERRKLPASEQEQLKVNFKVLDSDGNPNGPAIQGILGCRGLIQAQTNADKLGFTRKPKLFTYELLSSYESKDKTEQQQGIDAWYRVLQELGIEKIDKRAYIAVLQSGIGTYTPTPHADEIYNAKKVKMALKANSLEWMWRD